MVEPTLIADYAEEILTEYVKIPYSLSKTRQIAVCDRARGQFLIMLEGWEHFQRDHGCLVHLEIKDNKLWIQRDGTEDGLALEFERRGVPQEQMILAFYPPSDRAYADYAIE
jgi:hypothetical protein